jgi:hypothetical protein
MRVASEQASGEKYKSMGASLRVRFGFQASVVFYTVPHNIGQVKEFLRNGTKN